MPHSPDRSAIASNPHYARAAQPFRVPNEARLPFRAVTESAVGGFLRFGTLNRIYQIIQRRTLRDADIRPFADRALDALGVSVAVPGDHLQRIPHKDASVVVANHPFGGIEGLALLSMLSRVRPDVKLLANEMLCVVPDLAERIFPIDVFAEPGSRQNSASVRAAMRHVQEGGCLGVFPAGEVSHLKLRRRCVTDSDWQDTAVRIIRRTGATANGVFFEGRNSNWFQLAGLLHPKLRTVLLPTELLRQRGQSLPARVSQPIGPERLSKFEEPRAVTGYLRARTYLLRSAEGGQTHSSDVEQTSGLDDGEPLIAAVDPSVVAAELSRIPAERRLLSSGVYDVMVADADELPATMSEIGRLREWCFRGVGEGTGRPLDIDRFDPHYRHLIVWNRAARRIAGAYRLGETDRLLQRFGLDGLYTATLFRYRRRLFERLGPALELGRSFVHPAEQRGFQPLQLLWKGIGHYVVMHPRYRYLLGPVSISARYSDMSKQLLSKYLEAELPARRREHRPKPRPKNPPRRRRPRDLDRRAFSAVVGGLEEVNELVGELERDGKPMPVLLRQYLKLNARLLGFNVDPDFGEVLDALLLVDLAEAPKGTLKRYMGERGVDSFHARHVS
ncbi:MAG: lysophospholipid acyltransferase family protein [Planctomycetota bacterium]